MGRTILRFKSPRAIRQPLRATHNLPCAMRHAQVATCYVLLFCLFGSGCSNLLPYSPETVLAKVNGEYVTAVALEKAFSAKHQGHAPLLASRGAVSEFLEKVIDKKLLFQEARRIGLDQEPEIKQAVEQLEAKLAADQFYRDEVTSKVVIADEALVAAQEQIKYRFQARHILVENQEQAQKALERIRRGEDFGEVALQVSQAPTAAKGGYMGFTRWGQLDPEIEDRLWSLNGGEASQPFETKEGWNLLYVNERVFAEPSALDKNNSRIRAILTKRQAKQRSDALFRDLTARWQPKVHDTALLNILKAGDQRELPSDLVLAEIGDERITLAQFGKRVDLAKVAKIPKTMAMRAMRHLLEDDLFKILLRKEALARRYGEKPNIVEEVEARKSELVVDRLLKQVVFAKIDITDDEAKDYWQTHPKRFTEPEAVKLSVILTDTEEEARAVLAELRSGGDFARLARTVSKHQASAELGGAIGWVVKNRADPELGKVAFALNTGEFGIAQIRARFYSVIQVEEKKAERLKPFIEVKQQARMLALSEKSKNRLEEWVKKLREASAIEIDEEAIDLATVFYENKLRNVASGKDG